MQIACYNLPQSPMPIVGIQFKAVGKSGEESIFFWTPPYKSYPDSAWKWNVCDPLELGKANRTKQSSWKKLSKPLPQKRRDELQQFWNAQTDIGLWISEAKRSHYIFEQSA